MSYLSCTKENYSYISLAHSSNSRISAFDAIYAIGPISQKVYELTIQSSQKYHVLFNVK